MNKAVEIVRQGGVIAYPTEAVFGLGCDPFNRDAVERVLTLKNRPIEKGFILIASRWEQVSHLVNHDEVESLTQIMASWPGPVTWLFPAKSSVPDYLTGGTGQVALRITDHPIAKELCENLNHALLSTSANLSKAAPAKTAEQVRQTFSNRIDFVVEGDVGKLTRPTPIHNATNGEILRA